jgi:hypothetical protein
MRMTTRLVLSLWGSLIALGSSSCSGSANSGDGLGGVPNGGAPPGGGTAVSSGSPLPLDQLGVRRPIPSDAALAPDSLFENTVFDATKNLAIWVPPGRTLRGLLLLNGTPNAPDPADIAAGKKWRAEQAQDVALAARQLASTWSFALITGTTWTDQNRSNFDLQMKLFEDALVKFAADTKQPELAALPVAIQGGSRFSGFGPTYAQKRPGRVIAYVMEVAGAPLPNDASREVPGLIIPGSDDAGQAKIDSGFFPPRAAGASLGAAMNWGAGHECASCRDLSWPFFDRVILSRLSSSGGPLLRLLPETGWLGDTDAWTTVYPQADYPNDRTRASFLPDHFVANVWRSYTLKAPLAKIATPTQPYRWGAGFAQDPSTLRAQDPITITADLTAPLSGELTFYDGDVTLGPATVSADGKKASLANVKLLPGVHSILLLRGSEPIARPAGLVVLP